MNGLGILVLRPLIRNTIRKVTMVVPVLITSCHVSEKWKTGPVNPQPIITASATPNAPELPVHAATPGELLQELPGTMSSLPLLRHNASLLARSRGRGCTCPARAPGPGWA